MILKRTQKDINYLEEKYKIKVSKFMCEVLDILCYVYNGLHHTDYYDQFKNKELIQTNRINYIEKNRSSFSTYDWSELTQLVILAHHKGIRISISSRKDNLIIGFSNRMGKRNSKHSMSERHPTLKQQIDIMNNYYKNDKME